MSDAGSGCEALAGENDPGVVLGELMRLSSAVCQVLAQELGLSLTDLTALHHLVGRPSLGPAELAKRLGMSSASATVLADRLEHAGHVRRRHDPADRRRIILEVTDTAASRSLDAVRPMTEAISAIGDDLDEPTRQAITTYLARVAEAMAAFTDTGNLAQ